MGRMLVLLYGTVVYLAFFGTFLQLIAFVEDLGIGPSINAGPAVPLGQALMVDLGLIALFGVQHSIMARPAFKRWWVRFVPQAMERSTFVLVTVLILQLTFRAWCPIPTVVWEVGGAGATLLTTTSWIGWAVVLISTFIIDHFDLFGLKQTVYHFRGVPYPTPQFQLTGLYRIVRHPLMLGFLIAFWVSPVMTVGQLVLAVGFTLYILIAVQLEERDLARAHGAAYEQYQRTVSMLLPIPRGRE